MKKICFYLIFSLSGSSLYPQNKPSSSSLTGFDGLQWGSSYKDAKERFRTLSASDEVSEPVSIIADTPEREIRVKRNKLVYRYEFYEKPEILANADNSQPEGKSDAQNSENAEPLAKSNQKVKNKPIPRLFMVESIFGYVPAEELYKKISEKYGPRNGGNLDEKTNRGYYIWNLNRGTIIQWIDPYKKKPFSRSIYYVSKEIIDEIHVDFPKFQYSKELKTIMNLLY